MREKAIIRTRAIVTMIMVLAAMGGQSGFGLCLSLHHEAHVVPLGGDHDHEADHEHHTTGDDAGSHDDDAEGPCADEGCCVDLPIQTDSLTPRTLVPVQAPVVASASPDVEPVTRAAVAASNRPWDRPFRDPPFRSRSLPLRL